MHIRVPRRDLIVTKSNRAKIPSVKSSQNCLMVTMLRGFCSTTNPLCGIWIWSPLYKVMLWNQPFVCNSLQKGEVVIPGANSVQGLRQWPRQPAGQKNLILGFFVATVMVSVKVSEGVERENAYIAATRPSIKILSTLFTLQLSILVSWPLKV